MCYLRPDPTPTYPLEAELFCGDSAQFFLVLLVTLYTENSDSLLLFSSPELPSFSYLLSYCVLQDAVVHLGCTVQTLKRGGK